MDNRRGTSIKAKLLLAVAIPVAATVALMALVSGIRLTKTIENAALEKAALRPGPRRTI
jgi:hypothetical protein